MLRKILRKFQPNFQHYFKKIEAQAKKLFPLKKKRVVFIEFLKSLKTQGHISDFLVFGVNL